MQKNDDRVFFKNSLFPIAVLSRWSLRLLAVFTLRRGSLAPSPSCFNYAFMSTYSSRDALDSCASHFPALKQKGGKKINFLKGMYAVPKEVIWEMERELLKTGASAPLKSQSHDLSVFTQAAFLGL